MSHPVLPRKYKVVYVLPSHRISSPKILSEKASVEFLAILNRERTDRLDCEAFECVGVDLHDLLHALGIGFGNSKGSDYLERIYLGSGLIGKTKNPEGETLRVKLSGMSRPVCHKNCHNPRIPDCHKIVLS